MKKLLLVSVVIGVTALHYFQYFNSKKNISPIQAAYLEQLKKEWDGEELKRGEDEDLKERDRPDLAFIQEYEMTMDPKLGYPPLERRLLAFNDIKQKLSSRVNEFAAVSNLEWQERGPSNVGGRTRALMFDPNDPDAKRVWAGAIGGGLWYNNDITNAQSKWQNVGDMMANMAISSLAYDPQNTDIFYMSTGLGYTSDIQGDGIFKSTDGGATWDQLATTASNSDFHFVQKIAVTSSSTVIATTRTGIFRSTDGGTNWTNVKEGKMGDIEVTSNNVVYVTEGYANFSGGIYRSTDDGQTWTDITPDDSKRIEIESAPSNPDVLYAVADGGSGTTDVAWFKKSLDAGTTWQDIEIPNYVNQDCSVSNDHFTRGQAFFDLILAVHPEDPETVVVGGIDLHKTTDGGLSWDGVSYWTGSYCDDYVHADQHEIVFRPGYPNEAIFGSDGGVSYSADIGSSTNPEFDERNYGYNVTTFYAAAAKNEVNSSYFLAGAQDNGTQQFTEHGFGSTREATGGDGGYCFIDQDDGNIQITSYVFNSYRLSQDGGLSFISISDDQSSGRFINPTEYDHETKILYGAGGTDEFTRITNIDAVPSNLGTLSVDLGGRQITTIKKSPNIANRLFVGVRVNGGEGQIYKIDNANSATPTTTNITGSYTGSHGGWVSSIDVGASDDQLLATFSNYGVSSVYETMDGGANWTDKNDNLPDIPVRYGLYNPENRDQVLIATELGVWSTNDISATNPDWEPTNSGLANVRCDMLKYRPSDQLVVVATFGRGLYTTNVFATTIKADFKTDQLVGYVGVPVDFEDASLLPNSSWSWDFGDGSGTSAMQNPSYTYAAPGTYDISLTIDEGADTETKTGYVTILPVKATPYLAADGGDFESNPDDFASIALLNGVNHWELGTPTNILTTVNSGSNAWKTDLDTNVDDKGFDYASGLYTPAFDLSDDSKNYTVSFRKSMSNVYCNSPHALQLQYSTDGGATWTRLGSSFEEYGAVNWYNRGDNTGCSVERAIFADKMGWSASNVNGNDNTVHNEETEFSLNFLVGEPNVSFRFVSSVGSGSGSEAYEGDGFMIDDFEIVTSAPTAEFEAETTTAFIGQEIQFTPRSNGVLTYEWDFGDGSPVSTDANPVHSYSSAGTYTVSLSITSASGSDTNTKADYIFVLPKKGSTYTLEDGGNFESNFNDFIAENISGTPLELGNSSIQGKNGTASGDFAWVLGIDDAQYEDQTEAFLYTPVFDFSLVGSYTLSFKANYQLEDGWDAFIMEYSLDNGDSWDQLKPEVASGWYDRIGEDNPDEGWPAIPMFTGSTSGSFVAKSTDISDLGGTGDVAFRFHFLSDHATVEVGFALDDFELIGPELGPAVPDFTYEGNTGCDGQVVTFTNTSTGSISSLSWDFGTNATPVTATGIGPHEVTYSGTGLSTVKLTVSSPVNGIVEEEKVEIISTAPLHTPTFTEEEVPGNSAQAMLVASEGDAYQWYLNNELIDGATEQTYTTSEKGFYSVDVDVDGCSVNSGRTNVITALGTSTFEKTTFIYPNPATTRFTIDLMSEYRGAVAIDVYNTKGALVYQKALMKNAKGLLHEVNTTTFKRGIYFVRVQMDDQIEIGKVIIN